MNRQSTEDFRAVKLFYMIDVIIIQVITDFSKPMKYSLFPRGPTIIHSHSSVLGDLISPHCGLHLLFLSLLLFIIVLNSHPHLREELLAFERRVDS